MDITVAFLQVNSSAGQLLWNCGCELDVSEVSIDNLTRIFAIQDAHLKFDEQIRWSSLARMSNIDHVSRGHGVPQGATQAEMSHHVNNPLLLRLLKIRLGLAGGRAAAYGSLVVVCAVSAPQRTRVTRVQAGFGVAALMGAEKFG